MGTLNIVVYYDCASSAERSCVMNEAFVALGGGFCTDGSAFHTTHGRRLGRVYCGSYPTGPVAGQDVALNFAEMFATPGVLDRVAPAEFRVFFINKRRAGGRRFPASHGVHRMFDFADANSRSLCLKVLCILNRF
jgi:hypothetical protein